MRIPIPLVTAFALVACRESTKPPEYVPTYSLAAYTTSAVSSSPADSIVCQVYATWPSTEAVYPPWSGTVTVQAWRAKRGERLFTSPARTGSALLTFVKAPGDSVRVTLTGAVNLSLDGRMPSVYSEPTGQWTCGAASGFGTAVSGEARGIWHLNRNYLID